MEAAVLEHWERLIVHGAPFCDRKSTFQAHMAPVFSADEVKAFVAVLNRCRLVSKLTI